MVDESSLVSCVLPALDAAAFLHEAVESIRAQTHRVYEIIVVADPGSHDATVAIAGTLGVQVVLPDVARGGPALARNAGLRAARGEFVAFLDADDRWHPEKLARQLAVLQAQPTLGYCLSHAHIYWEAHLQEEAQRFQDHPRAQPMPGYATTTLLARRALFERVGAFNPALHFTDAIDWFLRAADLGVAMEMVPEVLTYRRIHGRNMSRVNDAACRAEFLRLVHAVMRRRRAGVAVPPSLDDFFSHCYLGP